MSNRTVLNEGMPAPPDPPEVTAELQRYGNALGGVFGTAAAPTDFGDFLRRVGQVQTVAVAANTTTLGPGAVLAVQATAGSATGPLAMIVDGAPASGQVLVEPLADGSQRLTFNAGDAVTQIGVYHLAMPAALLAFLDAIENPPP